MNKVLLVYGTRPDAVKMAPLIKVFKNEKTIKTIVCTTAQHRETIDMVNSVFNIIPDYDLNIMKPRQTLEYITFTVMEKFSAILEKENPDLVLVHGDTATCLICSLASYYKKIPVGHVEAGLRSHNFYSPFPEEMNRKLMASLATLHFSPTESNRQNLINENVDDENIFVTGNTGIDALDTTIAKNYTFECEKINAVDFSTKRVITLTAHRRENLGKPLENICKAVLEIAGMFEDVQFVYPVHPNPAVRETVFSLLGNSSNILLTDMINVSDSHNLMKRSYMVMTDSGGLQEEAPALGKPVLVLRRETERNEAVEMGTVKLSGIETSRITADAVELLTNSHIYNSMATAVNPYGDGKASPRILNAVKKYLKANIK